MFGVLCVVFLVLILIIPLVVFFGGYGYKVPPSAFFSVVRLFVFLCCWCLLFMIIIISVYAGPHGHLPAPKGRNFTSARAFFSVFLCFVSCVCLVCVVEIVLLVFVCLVFDLGGCVCDCVENFF